MKFSLVQEELGKYSWKKGSMRFWGSSLNFKVPQKVLYYEKCQLHFISIVHFIHANIKCTPTTTSKNTLGCFNQILGQICWVKNCN